MWASKPYAHDQNGKLVLVVASTSDLKVANVLASTTSATSSTSSGIFIIAHPYCAARCAQLVPARWSATTQFHRKVVAASTRRVCQKEIAFSSEKLATYQLPDGLITMVTVEECSYIHGFEYYFKPTFLGLLCN